MNILIIEHDRHVAEDLKKLLHEYYPEMVIAGYCTTIKKTSLWLQSNKLPDLIFSSVELPDGLSFQLFRDLTNRTPVIFMCKHENYAIDAFKANGIYYILKPIKKHELQEALQRYKDSYAGRPATTPTPSHTHYQERFLISAGRQLKLIKTEDISYFYTENKIVYLVTFEDSKYLTDYTLERLEQLLDPSRFFRINRQFIINISSIVKLEHASKSRFKVFLRPKTEHTTTTSFGRKDKFCRWMLGDLKHENRTASQD